MARVKGYSVEDDEKQGFKRGRAGGRLERTNSMQLRVQGQDITRRQNAANFGRAASRSMAMQAKFNRSEKFDSSKNLIEAGKKYRNASSATFPKNSQSTAEEQRKAYQRDGRLGRVTGTEMGNKPKPKYQTAPPPTPPKPPRKGGGNMDKGYTSSNPAKNRPYPGTVGQFGKALEKAYERGRADGARMAGAKTTSIKGRIPVVRNAPPRLFSSTGQRIVNPTPTGPTGGSTGRGGVRGDGVGRGGAIRLGPRRGFGER